MTFISGYTTIAEVTETIRDTDRLLDKFGIDPADRSPVSLREFAHNKGLPLDILLRCLNGWLYYNSRP